MAKYRLQSVAQLARQMVFASPQVRLTQLSAAEDLLHLLDPAKAYPLDFVIYRITQYRPKNADRELLTGLALQHDLGLLIEQVSDSLLLHVNQFVEPVLSIDDVCERFNVTSKTIQRWRRKALPARRFTFADGKRRVGFLLTSVERFIASHGRQVAQAGNVSLVELTECERIIAAARRLAQRGCCMEAITRRLARKHRRSPLTILHTVRKNAPEIEKRAGLPLSDGEIRWTLRRLEQGDSLAQIARMLRRPTSTVWLGLLQERIERIRKQPIRFCDDPLFHQEDAQAVVDALVAQQALADEPRREDLRVPRDLPPYLRELYRVPLLGRGTERALFLKLNFHRCQFAQLRRRLDPQLCNHRDLRRLEDHLARAAEAKSAIVSANLRLVVSVARRHLRPGINLMDLISDGNLTLLRAVDGFDVSRGYRFSTYATLALMKGFARSVPQMLSGAYALVDEQKLETYADAPPVPDQDRLSDREQVRQLLGELDERERAIVSARFGLGDEAAESCEQVARRMGLSKERVRQIGQLALSKLRSSAKK